MYVNIDVLKRNLFLNVDVLEFILEDLEKEMIYILIIFLNIKRFFFLKKKKKGVGRYGIFVEKMKFYYFLKGVDDFFMESNGRLKYER